jgi:hypothetical protein
MDFEVKIVMIISKFIFQFHLKRLCRHVQLTFNNIGQSKNGDKNEWL